MRSRMKPRAKTNRVPRGYFILLVLIFSAVFFTILSGLTGYIFLQKKLQLADENRTKAADLAEAGLEYYRWHLAHFPNDLEDGTGAPGPYVHTVNDPEGGAAGTFSLSVTGAFSCGALTSVSLSSTGASALDPLYKRTISARYAKPSVANYSTIVNANVWAGADRVISGPYHSNGGVRMDGMHNAPVSSGVSTWLCTSSFGCNPSANQSGIFGSGSNPGLWSYPAAPIDFDGISVDLAELKNYAATNGRYLAPSGAYGYRIVFRSNGTFDAYRVTGTQQVWGYSSSDGWQQERTVVTSNGAATNYAIPADCPVVFVEDNAWIEGVVSGKVTFAAADVSAGAVDRSIVIPADITYANASGDGLTAIGEDNVLIGLNTPDILDLRGIFIAQKGRFGRNHYCANECDGAHSGSEGLPGSLDPYVTRSTLNTTGTIVSNERTSTKWTSGGSFISGYNQRNESYDRTLASSPPPFTPATSDDYRFVIWQDEDVPQ